MLEREMTWFKASLLAMVYSIILSFLFVATIRLFNDLAFAMAVLLASCLGTLFFAAIRPRPELKLWLMLAAVSLAATVFVYEALANNDI